MAAAGQPGQQAEDREDGGGHGCAVAALPEAGTGFAPGGATCRRWLLRWRTGPCRLLPDPVPPAPRRSRQLRALPVPA